MADNPVVYVGGLPAAVDQNILYAAFLPFGEIKSVDLPHDRRTGIIFFVLFPSPESYARSIENGFFWGEYEPNNKKQPQANLKDLHLWSMRMRKIVNTLSTI